MPLTRLLWIAAALLVFTTAAANAQLYQVIDLGTLGGATSVATSINKTGRITGQAFDSVADEHAFRTASYAVINPAMDDLGFAGAGTAISDASVVCGYMDIWPGEMHAFTFGTSFLDLGTLGGLNSSAFGINATGKVVGKADTPLGDEHAFLFSGATMMDLGTLGGQTSAAYGINGKGRIVGVSETVLGDKHAFRTAALSAINPATDDLGTLGGAFSEAIAINASDVTVGAAKDNTGARHGFRYSGSTMTDLSTLGGPESAALAINTGGKIVGTSLTNLFDQHAFLWVSGVMKDLNDLIGSTPWTLVAATGINDTGFIVGYGTLFGDTHAFLLKPVQVQSVSVSPTKIAGCLPATGKVTLNVPAPADVVVALSDTHPNATVPANVTIPAGATSATFTVSTTPVAEDTIGAIKGTYGGVTKSANLTVMPLSVKTVTFSPGSVIGCKPSTGTVTLECTAAPGDITVTLTSGDASLASVPASIVIPAGSATGAFAVTTSAVTANKTIAISGTANGRSKSGNLTLKPITPKSVTLSPTSITGGSPVTGTVTLECPAGPGDITVALSSSITAAATVPASIVITAGTTSKTFTVTTFAVSATTKPIIKAAAAGVTKNVTLTVNP